MGARSRGGTSIEWDWFLLPALNLALGGIFFAMAGTFVVLVALVNAIIGYLIGEKRSPLGIQQKGGLRGLAGVSSWLLGLVFANAGAFSLIVVLLGSLLDSGNFNSRKPFILANGAADLGLVGLIRDTRHINRHDIVLGIRLSHMHPI